MTVKLRRRRSGGKLEHVPVVRIAPRVKGRPDDLRCVSASNTKKSTPSWIRASAVGH